jgi:hypothetical protein
MCVHVVKKSLTVRSLSSGDILPLSPSFVDASRSLRLQISRSLLLPSPPSPCAPRTRAAGRHGLARLPLPRGRGSRSRDEEEHNRRFCVNDAAPAGSASSCSDLTSGGFFPEGANGGTRSAAFPPSACQRDSPTPPRRVEIAQAFASSNSTTQPTRRSNGEHGAQAGGYRADFPDGFVFGVATSAYQVSTRPPPSPSHPVGPPSLVVPSRRVLAPCLRLHTARQLVHALACFGGSLLLRFESEW